MRLKVQILYGIKGSIAILAGPRSERGDGFCAARAISVLGIPGEGRFLRRRKTAS